MSLSGSVRYFGPYCFSEVVIMSKKFKLMPVVLAGVLLASLVSTLPAFSIDLGDLLKGAGIVVLVDKFGDELNDFVNKVTLNKGAGVQDRTKVVPILSAGQGGYAGAAQISGPANAVDKVKAVAQIETTFKSFRVKALVPVASKDVFKDLKRVSGVGVSAIIDVEL